MNKEFGTKIRKSVASILAGLLAVAACLWLGAAAGEAGANTSTIRLTISFPVNGADFSLFKVAEPDGENHLKLVGKFAESSAQTVAGSSEGSGVEAFDPDPCAMKLSGDEVTLAGYAEKGDEIAHIQANVPTELTLTDGLYLVTGTAVTENGTTYTPVSFYLSFPSYDSEGKVEEELIVESKYIPNQGSQKELRVVKHWAMDGESGQRPEEIFVEVLRDGAVVDTLKLSKENNWSAGYVPEEAGNYTVREKDVPAGYRVSVDQNEDGFILTNTWEEQPSVTPSATPTVSPTVTPVPEESPTTAPTLKPTTSTTTSEAVKTGDETKLSLWVALMMVSSAGMIILGMIMRIRGEKE
uniref:Cna B-type domain-containing protein n=1 Tax=Eubacterium cellulosolvens TaxID=29322 RepID=UPI000489491C|nr:Cna B-type domain-containing protein [[Eubacterium] cellulosolvens]